LVLVNPAEGYKLLVLPRQFFSEQTNLILNFSLKESPHEDFKTIISSKYVACASLNALSAYLTKSFNVELDKQIKLSYFFSKAHLHMDAATCKSLNVFPESVDVEKPE